MAESVASSIPSSVVSTRAKPDQRGLLTPFERHQERMKQLAATNEHLAAEYERETTGTGRVGVGLGGG